MTLPKLIHVHQSHFMLVNESKQLYYNTYRGIKTLSHHTLGYLGAGNMSQSFVLNSEWQVVDVDCINLAKLSPNSIPFSVPVSLGHGRHLAWHV